MSQKILHLVDDESIIHDIFNRIFPPPDYQLIISDSKASALINHHRGVDVVIMDLMLPQTSGIEIFKEIKKHDPTVKTVFLTAFGTIKSAIEAIKLGAIDYLQKPFNNTEIKYKIDRIIKENRIEKENIQLKKVLNERYSFDNIIGRSKPFLKVISLIENVSETDSTVLITGESGTGKELVAKAIYQNSNRCQNPFYAFNSSNIPPNLFESILFGYEKGSFTGAYRDKKGVFEEYDRGTIFIDEIANIDHNTQQKLLRVLEEKEFQPLGSSKTIKVDVRIIAATNEDLKKKVEKGEFREDLFYRLNVFSIKLPPLRARKDDIPMLLDHFIKKHAAKNNRIIAGYSQEFIQYLLDYNWPGNIRELENTVLRAIIMTQDQELHKKDLPEEVLEHNQNGNRVHGSFNQKVDQYKKELIIQALNNNNWIQKQAASDLGLKPSTLSELMKRLTISK